MRNWLHLTLGVSLVASMSVGLQSESSQLSDLENAQSALGISMSKATVSDVYWPDKNVEPDYFLIQDVHRHPQVQLQIAELIEKGYDQWGVKKVFLEGAFTVLDFSVFHRVPRKTQTLLLQRLVNEGTLSGPEVAAIRIMEREWRNPPTSPFQLFGLEDPALYRQNLKAYREVIGQRERAIAALLPIRRLQETMHLPEPNSLMQQLSRTEALLRLKLTPMEYAAYLQDKAAVPSTPALDPAIRAAEEFYQVAQERSEVFLKTAAAKVPASQAPRILVVGGFHTAFMAASLRQGGHSFVILTPAVTGRAEDDSYEKNLQETAKVLAQASPLSDR